MHNAARNDMACGTASDRDGLRFPAAAYMRELKWDRELEFTATKMVQSCIVEHDECRATSKFDNVGQNIAVHYAFLGENFTSLVQALVREWYDEYQDASVEDVEIVKG
ncbi:unnamed protein product [Hermetia illucens]|uniref:SCP domain-containing protein n=2 Tax=Hermetia illucens TaxID=343691 RepID=A0A7R8UEJ0_HERIL|nr:unnamed protein product [Hermetia illucens]